MCLTSCEKMEFPKYYMLIQRSSNKQFFRPGSYQNVESFYKKLGEKYGPKSFNKDGELDFSYIMKN